MEGGAGTRLSQKVFSCKKNSLPASRSGSFQIPRVMRDLEVDSGNRAYCTTSVLVEVSKGYSVSSLMKNRYDRSPV